MIKSTITAAALSLVMVSAGWALPAASTAKPSPQLAVSDLVEVSKKKSKKYWKKQAKKGYGKNYYKKRKHWDGQYWGGKHYRYRYGYRPYDWRARGCIELGSAWLCLR